MDHTSKTDKQIHTGGGASVGGNVEAGGDFVGRDKIVYGDEVHGNKFVNITLGLDIEVPLPPSPRYPPKTEGFVGREQEVAYYSNKLATTGMAAISGMPGVGKTWLAASLARQNAHADKIFWYSFQEYEQGIELIWELAGFIARHGQTELWQMLYKARLTGGQPPPAATLLGYVVQSLRGQGYLLCLDDFQFVDRDPLIDILTAHLLDLLSSNELLLIVTSRRLPNFVQNTEIDSLSGLNTADARLLLNASGIVMRDDLFDKLHGQIGGNAQLLTMVINVLKGPTKVERLVTNLLKTNDIQRYLFEQVDDQLNEEKRHVMIAVAVLLGHQGTRQLIEWLLNRRNLRRTLLDLCDQHLLIVTEGETEPVYSQHAILQSFYYEELRSQERLDMHRRIGEYYESEEPDVLKAALHFERAAEFVKSAQLITANMWTLINQFQAPALGHLLDQLDGRELSSNQQLQVKLARGQVFGILGDKTKARSSYDTAIAQIELLPDSPKVAILFAQACRGLSILLMHEDLKEARHWLLKGLDRLEGKEAEEEKAALAVSLAGAEAMLGNLDKARKMLTDGLAQLSPGPSQIRGEALINLLAIYFYQGDLETALQYSNLALGNDRALNDVWHEQMVLSNTVPIKFTLGRWKDALIDIEAALQLSKKLMDRPTQTAQTINLGMAHLKMGAYQEAKNNLKIGLELAQSNQLHLYELTALCGLAGLHVRLREWPTAESYVKLAEELAKSLAAKDKEMVVYRVWAELKLATAAYTEAIGYANRSIELARNLEMKLDQAIALRVLGQTLGASGSLQESEKVLKISLTLLEGSDKYEAARTQLELGRTLLQRGEIDYGRDLIDKAHSTFEELGVQYEL